MAQEGASVSCGRKIGPFDCCSVVEGDCLELMATLPPRSIADSRYFDLALTDPPYGLGIAANPIRQAHAKQQWDDSTPSTVVFDLIRAVSVAQIIWGGNYFGLPASQGFFVWDKCQPEGLTLAMCEQAWSSIQRPAKLYRMSVLAYRKEHPTQKPTELMEWCIKQAGEPQTIIDPFAGSGTTLVAARRQGLHFLGMEREPEYCAISRRRLAEIDAQPTLFEPQPEQLTL